MILERGVFLGVVHTKSNYIKANVKNIPDIPKVLTGARGTIGAFASARNLAKSLLPSELGINTFAPTWNKTVNDYLSAYMRSIPDAGTKLDISFDFVDENAMKYYETQLEKIESVYTNSLKETTTGKKESDLFNNKCDKIYTLEDEINEVDVNGKPKYGQPVNKGEYILWLYAFKHSHVANRIDDVDKSRNIRFYLSDEKENKKKNDRTFKLKFEAGTLLRNILDDKEKVDNLLVIYGKQISDEMEKHKALAFETDHNPEKFITLANDKNLNVKATITRMVHVGLLKQLEGSAIIVDGIDSSIIIGHTMDEAVTFFADVTNKQAVSEYKAKLKGLPK